VALGLLSTACGASSAPGGTETTVVASFYPLAEAASRVGGRLVSVLNLTPPGVEPHDLELAPDDVAAIAAADAVLYLGGGFQPAIEDAIAEADGAVVIDVLDAVQTNGAGGSEGLTVDPHVWLDPTRFQLIVGAIGRALATADPSGEATYVSNADSYADELGELDQAFRAGLEGCERSTIVTSHDAFGYLADAYGLIQVPIAGLSPESEPDARRLAELRDLVREEGVTTIFTEELVSPEVAETLAREAGVRVDVLNPIETLTQAQASAGEDYDSVMRANLDALRGALGCR
jgi:zinc transport system substrate-binding protein